MHYVIRWFFFRRGGNGRQEVNRRYHDKFLFFAKENRFLMLFQTCTKLTLVCPMYSLSQSLQGIE